MKKLIFLILFYGTVANAQLYIHAGSSPLKGIVGAEFQVDRFSLSAGISPHHLYTTGWFYSYCGALTTYFNIDVAKCYLSLGAATKGVVDVNERGMWTTPVPAYYGIFGTRVYPYKYIPRFSDRLSCDIGMGSSLTAHNYTPEFLIEFSVNWKLIR